MMKRELERFVNTLFVTADLQCIQNHRCNIVLELEDAESDTEESENEDDIVLHVEIKNGAFKTDEFLSQDLDQFISNVVTKANGKHHSCHNEVTAVLDISNKESNSADSIQCEEIIKDEAKASENNIPDYMKEISQFLIKNELQHLKEKFEMEEITIPALLQMDDADLKDIGIKRDLESYFLAAAKEILEKTFLKSLNLQYLEDCFKRQDVTINSLRVMDADDLVYMGVDDVLTRSKILDATKVLKPSQEIEESDTSDLSKFLHGIGLQKLTPKFEDEEISIEALIRMTDGDLKEIDIKKKGPRVLLLKSANKVKMMRQKTDIKFGQQLRKGEYENEQTIGKEIKQVMVPTAYIAFNQMNMFV
ncbi:ANKS6 [Mytilus edulis]|uniref:ANKS6 n=1 Tax=Mytilus edulis TaxID=6550 RepID=A0A8S3VIV7_MYTED|nr:ANKS6 [Mytilus edulis]